MGSRGHTSAPKGLLAASYTQGYVWGVPCGPPGRAPKSPCFQVIVIHSDGALPAALAHVGSAWPAASQSVPSPGGRDDEGLRLGDAPAGRQLLGEDVQSGGLHLRAVLRLRGLLPGGGCALRGREGAQWQSTSWGPLLEDHGLKPEEPLVWPGRVA